MSNRNGGSTVVLAIRILLKCDRKKYLSSQFSSVAVRTIVNRQVTCNLFNSTTKGHILYVIRFWNCLIMKSVYIATKLKIAEFLLNLLCLGHHIPCQVALWPEISVGVNMVLDSIIA